MKKEKTLYILIYMFYVSSVDINMSYLPNGFKLVDNFAYFMCMLLCCCHLSFIDMIRV